VHWDLWFAVWVHELLPLARDIVQFGRVRFFDHLRFLDLGIGSVHSERSIVATVVRVGIFASG
jgi:hypothetical protein